MALSDNVIRDGDSGFIGFASRLNPLTLPAGMLQDSVNMRLDRGVAQTRKGAKRLADDISTADEPLLVITPCRLPTRAANWFSNLSHILLAVKNSCSHTVRQMARRSSSPKSGWYTGMYFLIYPP